MTADNKLQSLVDLITQPGPPEAWKEIRESNGEYFISSRGRVLSLCNRKPRILKPFICGDGYFYVSMYYKDYRINRLVGEYFIPNKENKPVIHHKDFNKLNNNVNNLEWLTHAEHAERHKRPQSAHK